MGFPRQLDWDLGVVAQLSSPTSFPVDSIDDPLSRIARQTLALGAALVLFLCVVIVVRGLLGTFEAPESAAFPVLVAAIAELLASAFRVVWSRLYPHATRLNTLLARLGAPSICVVCVAVAMSTTQASGWAVATMWLFVAVSEIAWWYPEMRLMGRRSVEHLAAVAVEPEPAEAGKTSGAFDEQEMAPHVTQQMTRSRNDEGVEVISGVLRAEFAPGERTHNLHVAFCPPLMYEPQVVMHQLDGSPMTVKIAQSEIFGVRIELRLTSAAQSSENATFYFEVRPR
ncbi:MAG TPA: hypothetical protein VMM76_21965 [Pirellulaceae bacterium]|nr:hypothetical protein [Pirellulaceae bacterium]